MNFIFPDWPAPPHVGAISTMRRGGVSQGPYDDGNGGGGLNLGVHVHDRESHVLHNRALLRRAIPAEPVWLSQIHGNMVVDAPSVQELVEADASVSTQTGIACAIQTADCLPVLFCDGQGTMVGAAHAGWRGLVEGVLEATVERLRALGAVEILAWMGPAIGPQRFEVGPDVVTAFIRRDSAMRAAFQPVPDRTDKYLADIYGLARMTLSRIGIDKVYGGGLCTMTDASRFYSYRRDRITGRMATLIWLK